MVEEQTTNQDSPNEIAKQPKFSKAVEKEIQVELKPIFVNFYRNSPSFELYNRSLIKVKDQSSKVSEFLGQQLEVIRTFHEGIRTKKFEKDKENRLITLFLTNVYLSMVELVGNYLVNQAILFLIGNGCDFHLEPDDNHRYTRHASSLEDLESPILSMAVKLDFLNCNGLHCFSKMIDRNLRNKIAHMEFEINQTGQLIIKGRKNRIDLDHKISLFKEYATAISTVMATEIAKAYPDKSS